METKKVRILINQLKTKNSFLLFDFVDLIMTSFFQILVRLNDRMWEIKQSLEDKASKIITTNGIILPLFFGFILNSSTKLDLLQTILLVAGVFTATLSILNAARVIKPSDFAEILDLKQFVNTKGNLNIETINLFKNLNDSEIENNAINNYLQIINFNEGINKKRSMLLNRAYNLLKCFIVIISIFMIYFFLF